MNQKNLSKLIFIAVIFVLLLTGCDNGFLVEPEGKWEKYNSEYFTYFLQPEDEISHQEIEQKLNKLDNFWDKYAKIWEPSVEKVAYYKFISRKEVERLTGEATNGRVIAEEAVVHSINYTDAHEVAHIFTMCSIDDNINVGNFWLEGIAMHYTWPKMYSAAEELYKAPLGAYQGKSIHQQSKKLYEEDKLPKIKPLIYGDNNFNEYPESIVYPAAGSFVTYLIGREHNNPDKIIKFRDFLQEINDLNSTNEIANKFEKYFYKSIEKTEKNWHLFLKEWDESSLE